MSTPRFRVTRSDYSECEHEPYFVWWAHSLQPPRLLKGFDSWTEALKQVNQWAREG